MSCCVNRVQPLMRVMVEGKHERSGARVSRIAEAVTSVLALPAKWLQSSAPPSYDRKLAFAVFLQLIRCVESPCEGHSLWLSLTPASVGNVKTLPLIWSEALGMRRIRQQVDYVRSSLVVFLIVAIGLVVWLCCSKVKALIREPPSVGLPAHCWVQRYLATL